ncbi:hypothetical protein, partial [Mesomycoplasma ovipneumoniae]|uniref:hypothetical protein n=1 Tax=Mesomycoplasma ovipneumoniae TaxID=29562 RepID=UPI00307FE257
EDLLVRHFLPSVVRAQLTVKGATEAAAETELTDFILDLAPTSDLEASDVVDALYGVGATQVNLPFLLVALSQSVDRQWSASLSKNGLVSSRVQHFLPDTDELLVTSV